MTRTGSVPEPAVLTGPQILLNFQPSGHKIIRGSADHERSALAFPRMARYRDRCRQVGVWLGPWLKWIVRTRSIFEGV